MRKQWLAMERYRLACVETWPDNARKEAVIAAIQSTLNSLQRTDGAGAEEQRGTPLRA
jgi:hypothetical protein